MDFIDLKAQYARLQGDIHRRIEAVFEHGRFVMGPEVEALERDLATFAGTGHCIAVSSGTDALLLGLMALDLQAGDEVLTTPFSFAAAVEMALLLGCRPIYVDIDRRTYNIDPERMEAAITPRTKAIVAVSLFGQCADFDAINRIAARHGVPVIEDAAQAFGATYRGRRAGSLAKLGVTSFFPAKPLGAYGEGGACFVNDDALAERLRMLRHHGQGSGTHLHQRIGINGRFDTLQAAILQAKLAVYPQEIVWRQAAAKRYETLLEGLVEPPFIAPGCTSVYAQYAIQVQRRDGVRKAMTAAGVPTAVHYPRSLPRQPAFADDRAQVPVSDAVASRVLCLPMHADLQPAAQKRVAEVLRQAMHDCGASEEVIGEGRPARLQP